MEFQCRVIVQRRCTSCYSSVENIPLQAERHSARRQKLFAFPSESAFTFRTECCSESQRNRVRLHSGIAFTFDRIPQVADFPPPYPCSGQKPLPTYKQLPPPGPEKKFDCSSSPCPSSERDAAGVFENVDGLFNGGTTCARVPRLISAFARSSSGQFFNCANASTFSA